MTKAFVLGNGRSRLNVNPLLLKKNGTIYGCNALYREFTPDYLIAVDPKMILEICDKNYQLTNNVWTNPNSKYEKYKNLNFFKNPRGWSSGPTALLKASHDSHKEIFILGFDYYGINDHFNNVYADTENYKRSTDCATFYGNWMRQTETIIKEFPHIYYYRIIDSNCKIISNWSHINNFTHMNYEDFFKKIGI